MYISRLLAPLILLGTANTPRIAGPADLHSGHKPKTHPAKPQVKSFPEPAHLKSLDYRKGDEAKTFEEFKRAVTDDYRVTSNENAKIQAKFSKAPIIVYGEVHTDIKLPSIHGKKGAVLLEHPDPEFCRLEKYNRHPDDKCVHIDSKIPDLEKRTNIALIEARSVLERIIEAIEPGKVAHLIKEANQKPGGNFWHYYQGAKSFIQSQLPRLSQTFTEEQARIFLESVQAFQAADKQLENTMNSGYAEREAVMAQKSIKTINSMDDDAAVTAVVGDSHSSNLAQALSQTFPDRAVIVAHPKDSPVRN